MMETEYNIEVKTEPINLDEDGLSLISDQDEENQMSPEKDVKRKQSRDVSPAGPSTPPYYTQNHDVGGKWKVTKEKKQYNCKTCRFKFTSKTWLIKHERMHENMENKAKLYKCATCRKEFTQKIIYHDHMAAHAGQRPYVCDRCGKDFTWYRAFYRHQKSHKTGGQAFSCHLCHRKFNSNWNLARHLKEIHLSQQTFKCDICEELFEKKNLYQIHMKAHDRQERERKKENGVVTEKVKQKHQEISKIVCAMVQSQCENNNKIGDSLGIVLSSDDKVKASELIGNIMKVSDVESTNASDEDSNDEFFQEVSKPQETGGNSLGDESETILEQIQCQAINSALAKSMESIIKPTLLSGQKLKPHPCTCDICGKSVHNLDAHLRIHSGEKPFKCSLCDKDFAQREALKVHYRSHTGEKPFLCSTCGKGFATRGLQQDHARAHKGDKPYQCNVCDARFSWRCALSRHKQLHSSGPKPHSCSVCTFECWRKHDLTKHERTHLYDNHYQCDFENCKAIFTNKKHFVKHKKEHTSPRNGRILRLQRSKKHNDTDQTESNENHKTDTNVVEIKQEPVDVFVNDEHQALDENTTDTPTMYLTSNEGQMETVITNTTGEEETDPDSGKLRYVKGKRLHLNQDLQRLLSKKLNERKLAKPCLSGGGSSNYFASKIEERTHQGTERQTSCESEVDTLEHQKHQVTVSMDAVIETVGQSMKPSDKAKSSSNLVCCEVCGKTLNISYYHIHVRKHLEGSAHTCEICNKSFSRRTDLIVHSRVHTNIRPFQCNICSKAFKVKSLLDDHVRSHDGIKPYVCNLCDASFAWRCAFHRHVKTHSVKKPFQCDVCGKDFRRRSDWAGHIEKKTCKLVKSIIYKCNDCQAVFANLETLVYHNDKHHKETPSLNVSATRTESSPFLETSSDTAETLLKGSILLPSNELKGNTHVFTDDSLSGSGVVEEQNKPSKICLHGSINSESDSRRPVAPCDQFIASANSNGREEDYSEGTNEVEDENKSDIPLPEGLFIDIKKECEDSDSMIIPNSVNATDSMEYSSTGSTKDPTNQSNSEDDHCHTDTKMIPLDTNEFAVINSTGENLQIGTSSVNGSSDVSGVNGDRLKCKICGRGFVSSIGLKVHLRIHSKDAMDIYALHFRPDELMTKSKKEKEARNLKYKCELCDKTFPFASGLRIHMMAHSGKLPYSCKTCGKRFPYLESLKSHMRVHTGERPFTCNVCGKSFAYRHNHDDHYRTHTGDKPYKCDRCDSAFTWKSALHRHHKTHSLETLEVCTICKAKFKNGGQLVRHMNRFHSSLI